jgi:hypothetical protein
MIRSIEQFLLIIFAMQSKLASSKTNNYQLITVGYFNHPSEVRIVLS